MVPVHSVPLMIASELLEEAEIAPQALAPDGKGVGEGELGLEELPPHAVASRLTTSVITTGAIANAVALPIRRGHSCRRAARREG